MDTDVKPTVEKLDPDHVVFLNPTVTQGDIECPGKTQEGGKTFAPY